MKVLNQQIVNLRGIAILFVLLGHSIIIYDNTFALLKSDVQMPLFEACKHLISFVQMKLFISISGFLLAYKCLNVSNSKMGGQFALSKAGRLLIPYLFVVLFYNDPLKYLLGISGYEHPLVFIGQQMLGMNCAHLWYLPCLFLLMMIGYPLFVWARKNIWLHCVLFFAFLGVNYFSTRLPEYFQLNQVGYYLVFFHLGYLVNYVRILYSYRLEKINTWKKRMLLVSLIIGVGFAIYRFTSIGFEIFLSVIAVLSFYALVPDFRNKFINAISKRSYGLYLFHSPLIYLAAVFCPNINPWLMLFINFICMSMIAYTITVALSKTKLKFIIGE